MAGRPARAVSFDGGQFHWNLTPLFSEVQHRKLPSICSYDDDDDDDDDDNDDDDDRNETYNDAMMAATTKHYHGVGQRTFNFRICMEQRLRIFENEALRKIFGAKRDEVTGELRKLHNIELHALYSSPDIIRNIKSRRLRWAEHVTHMGESRNAYRVLAGRSEGKRLLRRPRRRWEDNIKMYLREVDMMSLTLLGRKFQSRGTATVKEDEYEDVRWEGMDNIEEYCDRVSRLRVFENKVLRKIFGAKRDEVTGEWTKLHNAELHALYSSPDIIRNIKSRRLRWAGHVARMGESRNAYRVLVGRPEGKRALGRPRRRWEDNIKIDLREVGYVDRDWIRTG
ncbi:hypothetical protein ANN_25773 [Periplaneta americana]|uniref:Uncharacterized protein n=1 Tax=Periplaneta americana TaxID=6978 RepID=A0ABQ8S4L7_PERAM|nr:hypothetical protein ANN_25773 [Periplaneta americana]